MSVIYYLNRGLTIAVQLENDEEKALILHFVGVAYRAFRVVAVGGQQ